MEKIIFAAKEVQGKKVLPGRKHFALKHIDFELPAGYIMGIIGENGAGKTTFFHYIMDEKKRYQGKFYLDGKDIADDHAWAMNQIGFVSEEQCFLRQKSVKENVKMLGSFYDVFDMELFEEILEQAKLSAAKTIENLSRGAYIKFQLAFAMAHKPKLFLLDEPTAGMDPVFRKEFYHLLRQQLLEQGCSVIMSSHLEDDIRREFDYIGRLEHGEFVSFQENREGEENDDGR